MIKVKTPRIGIGIGIDQTLDDYYKRQIGSSYSLPTRKIAPHIKMGAVVKPTVPLYSGEQIPGIILLSQTANNQSYEMSSFSTKPIFDKPVEKLGDGVYRFDCTVLNPQQAVRDLNKFGIHILALTLNQEVKLASSREPAQEAGK